MNEVLAEQNSLMEKIVQDYGGMIRAAVHKASSGLPCAEDIISEVYFAVLLTLRKLGDGWRPPRSFIHTVIRNKVNDFLRQKYRDKNGLEEVKKRLGEQAVERDEVSARVHTLTHCEFQVFRLLGLGLTNQEIAESLHISLHTVRSHVKKVHAKCGVRDRAKLALIAHQACHAEIWGESEVSWRSMDASRLRTQEHRPLLSDEGVRYLRRSSRPEQSGWESLAP